MSLEDSDILDCSRLRRHRSSTRSVPYNSLREKSEDAQTLRFNVFSASAPNVRQSDNLLLSNRNVAGPGIIRIIPRLSCFAKLEAK
jgi:hypothetical protein